MTKDEARTEIEELSKKIKDAQIDEYTWECVKMIAEAIEREALEILYQGMDALRRAYKSGGGT